MDFLKKDSSSLKFKKDSDDNKDSFENIPPPPKDSDTQVKNSEVKSSENSFPEFPEPTVSSNEQNNQNPSSVQEDHSEFMPSNNFDEQPESPKDEPLEDIGWNQDPAYKSSEPKEVLNNKKSENPFEDNSEDSMDLPDLPDIPNSVMKESLGANTQKEENSANTQKEESQEVKSFTEVNSDQEKINEAEQTNKSHETEEKIDKAKQEDDQKQTEDELPELEADYLPEDEAIEEENTEQFVESHQFYETLQDIKALKRGVKDADQIMKSWSEIDKSAEDESEKFIENIDTLQEEMIKIDSTLFEEG